MSNVTPITAARRTCGEVCSASGCDQSHGCPARRTEAAKGFPQNLDPMAWADEEPEISTAEMLGYALIFCAVVVIALFLSVFAWALP